MKSKRGLFNLALESLIFAVLFLPIAVAARSDHRESREFESLIRFLRAVDPENVLGLGHEASRRNPCLGKWKGVKCNPQANSVVEISLDKSNLRGVLDTDSLCKLSNLRALSLAENRIRGTIPHSIVQCKSLKYLNLSDNLLTGTVPRALIRLKDVGKLDISKNYFKGLISDSMNLASQMRRRTMDNEESTDQGNLSSESQQSSKSRMVWSPTLTTWILVVVGLSIMVLIAYLGGRKLAKLAKENANLKSSIENSPSKTPLAKAVEEEEKEEKPEASRTELVFFVEEHERFTLEDLLEATADMRSYSVCSTLYKVGLKNGIVYAVRRMKNLQVSFEEFGKIMRQIGAVKHSNILPLVAYSSTPEDKLLIYKYQNKGSLLDLFEEYIEGKSEFQWRLRLSLAGGIARGLKFIYENPNNNEEDIMPHGNITLSNILLAENDEPLISEFGYSRFLDPNKIGLCTAKGYAAPESGLTEKSDVYSFGVLLLELLTGKAVEKTGLDLPKWVNAMIREEWTGEVFDKKLARSAAAQWAFPLLNVALKCVSYFPENRPSFAEVLDRIDEVACAEEDHSMSALSSANECHKDCCILHSIIPETWDSPGSNY